MGGCNSFCSPNASVTQIQPNTKSIINRRVNMNITHGTPQSVNSNSDSSDHTTDTQFTFVVNDQHIQTSPESSVSPRSPCPDDNPLSIWLNHLCQSPKSLNDCILELEGDTDTTDTLSMFHGQTQTVHQQISTTDENINMNLLLQSHDDKTPALQIPNAVCIQQLPEIQSKSYSLSVQSPQANLYRDGTERTWDMDDIRHLEHEMQMQLQTMNQGIDCEGEDKRPSGKLSLASIQANLCREQTDTVWDVSDIEDLAEDMKMEMEVMRKLSPPVANLENQGDWNNVVVSDDDGQMNVVVERRCSNLVQTESCDWDSDELEKEEMGIKKQIKHLRFKAKNVNSIQ